MTAKRFATRLAILVAAAAILGGIALTVTNDHRTKTLDRKPAPSTPDAPAALAKNAALQERVLAAVTKLGVDTAVAKIHVTGDGTVDVDVGRMKVSDLAPLRGLPIRDLRLYGTDVSSLTPLEGMPLEYLELGGCRKLTDLTPLAKCRTLKELRLYHSSVRDLAPLKGSKLSHLWLAHTAIADFSPLRGLPLQSVFFDHAPVTDISPLLDCPTIEQLCLSTSVENVELLRKLPALKFISYTFDGRRLLPDKTAEQFWAEFDQQKKLRITP